MTATSSLLIIACVLVSYSVHCGNYQHYQQQPVPNPYHRRQHPYHRQQHRPHYYYRKPVHHQQWKPARINPVPIASPVTAAPTSPAVHAVTVQTRQRQTTVVDVLVKNTNRYSTLITAVQKVGLDDTLSNGGPFTIFAPTNDAFNALPEGALAKLLDNPQELKKVLLGHVSSGNYPVALIRTGDLSSLDEGSHHIAVTKNGVTVNGVNVIGQELVADNGVIHTIDKVLLPQSKPQSIVDVLLKNSDTYSTLITAVKTAQLVETLSTGGPFTLFAPTNEAFAALPEGALAKLLIAPEDLKKVLLGHVSSGNYPVALIRSGDLPSLDGVSNKIFLSTTGVTVDGVNVIGNELLADNGVIHTINGVILHAKKKSIVDILVENSDAYSTLITAVKAVDLVETLSTDGPFTLFAPTNAAFDALPEGALAKLLDSPSDLKKVLLGHVSSGNYPVALVRSGDLLTLDESTKKIVVSDEGVVIGSSNVIGKELIAANGVIHTIDRVILPAKKQSIVDILVENSDTYSTLITAVKAVDLVETLATGGPFTLFAPTNAAFDALPEGALAKLLGSPTDLKKVLLGHVSSGNYPVALVRSGDLLTLDENTKEIVVSDQGVVIGSSNVIGKELIADNGVIHTIDRVILPQSPPSSKPQSIVDILIKNDEKYSTLVAAVKAVELVDTLATDGPFTLFAPTNVAFAALPEGTIEKLLAAPEELKKILLRHVVSGNIPVALIQSGNLTTLSRSVSKVDASADGVKIDEANVIGNEFIADNGVIHTIDKVLLHK